MNGVIIYESKYGANREYAEWLGKALELQVLKPGDVSLDRLSSYDLVILGSSVCIGKLLIGKWLKKNANGIINKKLFLFVVCGTPADQRDKLNGYLNSSIPENIKTKFEVFFLPGKMILNELSWFDRFLLRMGAKLAKDPEDKKHMLTEYNSVEKQHIQKIITAVKKSSVMQTAG